MLPHHPLLVVYPAAAADATLGATLFVLSGASGSLFVRWNGICKMEKRSEERRSSNTINLFISQGRLGPSHHANWSRDCGFPGLLQARVESYRSNPLPPHINPLSPWARPYPYRAKAPPPLPPAPAGCSIWLSCYLVFVKERTDSETASRLPYPLIIFRISQNNSNLYVRHCHITTVWRLKDNF